MSVGFKAALTSAVVNAAFMSRTVDTSTVGQVDLLKASGAGPTISNLQLEVNNKTTKTYTAQSVTGSGTITLSGDYGMEYRRVIGNGGPVTTSNTPFSTTPSIDGALIEVVGTDDTNTVTVPHNDASGGCILNGSATLKSIIF